MSPVPSRAAIAERAATLARLRHYRDRVPGKGEWMFNDAQVDWAIGVVETLDLDRIEHWRDEEGRGPGGVEARTPIRALLVAMVLGVAEQLPYLATTYRDILYLHISTEKRTLLGVPEPGERDPRKRKANTYRSVVRCAHRLFDLMDPSPLPKNRRLTPEQFEGATKDLSAETIGIRYDRLTWFINRIVEASLAALPREFRRRWNGHVGIDATPIKAYSGYDHCTFTAKNGKTVVDKVITKASDPDAGPYARDVDHRDPSWPDAKPGRKVKKAVYAHEASLVIMGPDGPNDDDGTFPYLFVAMAPLHRPGADPGGNGIAALASMVARGYPTGLAAGDRAYTSAMPEKYAYPARALGFELVLDYKDDQLGVMGEWAGALFIEGAFYCPSIPPKLIAATIDYRGGRITEDVWQSRLAARAAYEMRPNQRPGTDGHLRMLCPAAGAAPTARCELKAKSQKRATSGRTRIRPPELVLANPPQVCRQQTVTFPPEALNRYGQALPYGSPQWHAAYALLRNAIEGGNGHLKEASGPAIGEPARRRIRGTAAQSVFVALGLFSLNLERIKSFLENCEVGTDGVLRTRAKEAARVRRITESLQAHAPTLPTGDPPPDES